MVSEGIDIRRLRVVVYLTNRLTLLAFRQIVGRVVRTDPANVDDHGRVYIPADPTLIEMARQVTDDVDLLPPPMVITTDLRPRGQVRVIDEDDADRVSFETLETVGELGEAFDTSGREADRLLIECARLFIEREGLSNTDPESLALIAAETPALRERLIALEDEL
jgi:superfamily II DNA or RNA helicase